MQSIVKELGKRRRKDFAPGAALAVPLGGDGAIALSSLSSVAVEGGINEAECSVKFCIVTRDEDREGDVIEPRGCLPYLQDYKRNPVVLYEHDAVAGGIGLSSHERHGFCFDVMPDKILAKCFYHMRPFRGENLSAECWELARRGFLLGASIGFLPVEAERRPDGRGMYFRSWRPTEWSNTFQPVNAGTLNEDVLRMSLSRGYVQSQTLTRKLKSLLPPAKAWANGASLMSKPKIGAIEFDATVYTPEQAESFLRTYNHKSFGGKQEFPGLMVYKRSDIDLIPGSRMSLAKGVTALMGKAMAKNEYEDEDLTPMDEEKIEKADDDENDVVDEPSEIEEPVEVEETADMPGETPEVEGDGVDLKAAAQTIADLVQHVELMRDTIGSTGHPETDKILDKLKADADKISASLRKHFGSNFGDVALEAMMQANETAPPAETPAPMDADMGTDAPSYEDVPEDDEDQEEVLKALTETRNVSLTAAKKSTKLGKSLVSVKA